MTAERARVGGIAIKVLRDEVRFYAGATSAGLRFLKFTQLRQLADALHDIADEIENGESREDVHAP